MTSNVLYGRNGEFAILARFMMDTIYIMVDFAIHTHMHTAVIMVDSNIGIP